MTCSIYDDCMNHHTHAFDTKQETDHVSTAPAPLVSEMLTAFLDHLRSKSTAPLPHSSAMKATSKNSLPQSVTVP